METEIIALIFGYLFGILFGIFIGIKNEYWLKK